jgi:hypothetical protein
MSKATTIYTLMAALLKAEELLGKKIWVSINDLQKRFLVEFFEKGKEDVKYLTEIQAIASRFAEEINKFLAERGFSIRLEEFLDKNSFGVAAILDVMVQWVEDGKSETIQTPDKKQYPGVRINRNHISFFRHPDSDSPLVRIRTKGRYEVLMTMMPPEKVPDSMDLILLAKSLMDVQKYDYGYHLEDLIFPMVDIRVQPDISFIQGLRTEDDEAGVFQYIRQAKQETRLRMNLKGARVQDAVVFEVATFGCAGMPRQDHIINKPFLCIFTIPGGPEFPIAVFYLEPEDSWKDPGSLD